MSPLVPAACASARELVHRALDGEALPAAERAALGRHLLTCADCRELRDDLERLRLGLQELPMPGLPREARAAVLAATVGSRGRRGRVADWLPLAAAAALVVVMIGLASIADRVRPPHDEAEVRAAERQARMVLEVTAAALRRSERAAFDTVLAGEVSPALERVPIRWPEPARGSDDL